MWDLDIPCLVGDFVTGYRVGLMCGCLPPKIFTHRSHTCIRAHLAQQNVYSVVLCMLLVQLKLCLEKLPLTVT